jgi:ATP-dependent helicase HrpA
LKIWQAASAANAWKSSNALRKLCRASFLSFVRMREWRDVYGQLADTMGVRGSDAAEVRIADGPQADAVHRAVLSALLGHVARREERNVYKGAGNRQVQVFPGSHVFERAKKMAKGATPEKSRQPVFIMAAEIVETSQLFARTLAGIQPEWVVDVGGHLCEFRYSEPLWDEKTGRVLALERVLLHGLELQRGRVDYGKIDPVSATEIFIRYALLEDSGAVTHSFHAANRRLRDKLETVFARARSQRTFMVMEALFDFYKARLERISSVHDLNRLLQSKFKSEPDFLLATEADLTGGREEVCDPLQFPDTVQLGNSVLPVSYAYRPGGERDGVTVQVPADVAQHLTSGKMQWMVPGLRAEIIGVLLRALPKATRKRLMPYEHKIKEITEHFDPGTGDFLIGLSKFITNRYDIPVMAADWPADSLPEYLKPRVQVMDRQQQVLATSRDLNAVRREGREQAGESSAWLAAAAKWEKQGLTDWTFGDLPESIVVETLGGVAVLGWPGLVLSKDGRVSLKLHASAAAAESEAPVAVRRLAELVLAKDIAWLQKELRTLASAPVVKARQVIGFQDALARVGTQLSTDAYVSSDVPALALEHLLRHVLRLEPLRPLTEFRFREMTTQARRNLPLLAGRVRDLTKTINGLIDQLRSTERRYNGLEDDLARLVPPDYLKHTPHERLEHLPRYLKAMLQRGERAWHLPAKDAERARLLAPFRDWKSRVPPEHYEAFRWMLEEFRVSVFAQELGTAQPVSAKRLEALLEES